MGTPDLSEAMTHSVSFSENIHTSFHVLFMAFFFFPQKGLSSPQVLDENMQNYFPRIESLAFIDPVATL